MDDKRRMWLTLVAMTLSSSMILVDQTAVPLSTPDAVRDLGGGVTDGQWILTANILPLAAFMVLGGRLGDLLGLRRIFLIGAFVFAVSTALAATAQDMPWMIAARALQGTGAALMMPTSVAITSAVWPVERRGYALGILAGASAFFAALGPVMGGLLTSIDWRLVFVINVPLALAAIAITRSAVPPLRPTAEREHIDFAGSVVFAIAIVGLVYGVAQGQPNGWGSAATVIPLGLSAVMFVAFVVVERHVAVPLIDFRLLRSKNFLAANISQVLAGMIELGLGFLLPFFLLLVIGVGPALAGIALIPGTIPIIAAGPLAGRWFDRHGGRIPLTAGFLVLAGSGAALAIGAGAESVWALIPGLVLQGVGLGVVLTVNDPTGLNAVPEDKQGLAAGMINTAEQMGGAIGIAGLLALELGYYYNELYDRLAGRGIDPTPKQVAEVRDFIVEAEQRGIRNVPEGKVVRTVYEDLLHSHIDAFQLAFLATSGIALIGAVACFLLVRRESQTLGRVFGRRSRWVLATQGRSGAITRHPPDAP